MNKKLRIGVLKYMDHTSLDRIEAGTLAGLDRLSEEYGIELSYDGLVYDGQADMARMRAIGQELADQDVDAVITIATPPAVAVKETLENKRILLVFRAVSDPVGAGLVPSFDEPGEFITGSSDSISGRELTDVLLAALPEVKKVGLLYNRDDFSSKLPIAEAKEQLTAAGIEWIEATPEDEAAVKACAEALLAEGVDAVLTPTDNIVAGAERTIAPLFLEAGVPHLTGSHSFCINGALTGLGSRYKDGDSKFDALMEDLFIRDVAPQDTAILRNPTTFVGINEETMTALGLDRQALEQGIRALGLDVVFLRGDKEIDPEGDL